MIGEWYIDLLIDKVICPLFSLLPYIDISG